MKRINITIDEELLKKADVFSKKRFLSRSGLISLALSTYLDSVDNIPSFSTNVYEVKG